VFGPMFRPPDHLPPTLPLTYPKYSHASYSNMADTQWGSDIDSVYLLLLCHDGANIGLKIPLTDMRRNFKRPLKCLQAMAYAVLGVPGHLSLEAGGAAVSEALLQSLGPDLGGKVYYYVTNGGTWLIPPASPTYLTSHMQTLISTPLLL
jgi:hypothetical protein